MKTTLVLVTLAATQLSLPASAGRVCLRQDQIHGWNAPDDRTVIVEDDFRKKFKLTLMTTCQELRFHERLGFKSFGNPGINCITPGDEIVSGSAIGPQRCAITTIELYTPEMEKADKAAKAAAKAAAH